MRVVLHTLGCRLNQSETDAMAAMLVAQGHELVDALDEADLFVLNSCTITHQADADARRIIGRARRNHPGLKIAVTGCYANADPEGLAARGDVDWVLGNGDKAALLEHLPDLQRRQPSDPTLVSVSSLVRRREFASLPAVAPTRRTRALLKVQDGCNYRCAFCIVPSVRGPSRSLNVAEVGQALERLVAAGVPEIVLTGIHLGTYGRDLRPRRTLTELVASLLPRLGPARLRLSSLDPHEVDDDLIELMARHPGQICRHLHLPVQSGDEGVLRRMRRGHTAQTFEALTRELAARVPGIAIGTDVIVGFPGEDDAAFARTRELLARLPLAYHHVFTYSRRTGTPAATMPEQVPKAVRAERNRSLRALSHAQTDAFALAFAGAELDAVIERGPGRRKGELWARTDNYLHVPLQDAPAAALGRRMRVRLHADARAASPA